MLDAEMTSLVRPGGGTAEWIWRNGELSAWGASQVHVTSVGHASVAAVFEGIKAYLADDGERLLVFRLEEHLDRLRHSARICRLALGYDTDDLRAAVLDVLRANRYRQDTYIRPWAFPAGLIRELMVPADPECEVVIDTWPFQAGVLPAAGCRAAVSSWRRISEASMPPRVKAFSNYHNGRLALMEARENGHDWPILLNDRGLVSEGPGACLAVVRDGVVSTPSLTSGVLESITRDTVLTLLRDRGPEVLEREIDRTELYLADEIFFMGTAWEILPVTTVDGLQVGDGSPGPVTVRLATAYRDLVRGRTGDYPGWFLELAL